ncbi:hypothetical protein AN639_03125 [Candidatus Epulonipiscium fishelsonii]|uniref:Uncharacterized protein n=1 Tax=Candidatus Epulonipiscium fishelsonii TaxID=77094 RepID=A0ACC8XGF5_9FIRM|nr:hypothetical protein AN639_03125 [Epulopiscium sp. SCG-B05WGA-EpuloA1]ONI42608.1 hypothetical protein AN396_13580 [Epulopiscium sp. SCG-B11WGA-EpuloA1]
MVFLGFVFELGFNMGILSYMQGDLLNRAKTYLSHESYQKKYLYNKCKKEMEDFETGYKNVDYFLFKGLLSGSNFFNEWVEAKTNGRAYKVEYFQANFLKVFEENKLKTEHREYIKNELKLQLNVDIEKEELDKYSKKGEFVHADSIILISVRNKYHLCVIDNYTSVGHITNFYNIENLKNILEQRTNNLRKKSTFSNLSVDSVNNELDINIQSPINNYLLGEGNKDKPLSKMIQAGSYADSFIEFLENKSKINIKDFASICVAGYTDKEICTTNLNHEQHDILKQYRNLYNCMDLRNIDSSYEYKQELTYKIMRRNLKKFFDIDSQIFEQFENLSTGVDEITFEEVHDTYQNTAGLYNSNSFRNEHAQRITNNLKNKSIFILFLTGNAGIGKTTAIVEYLKNKQSGYIFLYLSPRLQVNQDIKHKFCNEYGNLYDNQAVYLTRSGTDVSNSINIEQLTDTVHKVKDTPTKGVLHLLCEDIHSTIKNNVSNKIIATASIQSLKQVGEDKTTAKHLIKMFRSIYNEINNTIIMNKAENFVRNFKDVIIMIDEITGDAAGVEFLKEIINIVIKNIYEGLSPSLKQKVNFKIIVADASITNKEVILKHLKTAVPEPDKIYFKKVKDSAPKYMEEEVFKFQKLPSVIINTNSFPAKSLRIKYNLILDNKGGDTKIVDEKIVADLEASLKEHKQVIIYIQNKARLEYIQNKIFDKFKQDEYLVIHSSITNKEKNEIDSKKNNAKIILMTSSASRGISFPKATAILVDVPNFSIEQNIMEILQVIYRGRGNEEIDKNNDKSIYFYIHEVIWDKNSPRSLINIFGLLILLKTSILTRIYGNYKGISLIPIGGKGISASSVTLVDNFSSLLSALKREFYKSRDVEIKVLMDSLYSFLDIFTIETNNEIFKQPIDTIKKDFYDKWNNSITDLIDFKPLKNPKIIGDLMIFEIKEDITARLNISANSNFKKLQALLIKHKASKNFNESIRKLIKDTLETINYFAKTSPEKSKDLLNTKSSLGNYVAIPIATPFILKELEEHEEVDNKVSLKNVLERYVKSNYNINNVLPITQRYKDIPYISFSSASLSTCRNQIFNQNYLLCSTEINLVNLMLLKP